MAAGTSAQQAANPLGSIPDLDIAIAEFNSVPSSSPPYRDIPSKLLTLIHRPDHKAAEPDWAQLLSYFTSSMVTQGIANLQDLHIFMIRVVLPNAIVTNRQLLTEVYRRREDLPVNLALRYDSFNYTPLGQTNPNTTPIKLDPAFEQSLRLPVNIVPRPIFRSRQTPDPAAFANWLLLAPPTQALAHRGSELDGVLTAGEVAVRQLTMEQLLRGTVRALNLWWFISHGNARMNWYLVNGLQDIERECL